MADCAPRCFCRALLTRSEDGFRCPRCGRIYDSTATLPACKHPLVDHTESGDVRCRNCECVWREADT